MNIDEQLKITVTAIISDSFAEGIVKSVEFESVSFTEESATIKIRVILDVESRPDAVADSYFGLTGKVRAALGDKWQDFFPVITPVFGQEAYA